MQHLLAADLAATNNSGLRWMAGDACSYLLARGDTRAAYDLARDLRHQWQARLGDDDETVLAATHYLGWALEDMGRYAEARDLHQDSLERARRLWGEDHPDTLVYANQLGIDMRRLEKVQVARGLDQDSLDRRRRVLGEDHPSTLGSASNLAHDLRELGEADDIA